MVYSGELKNREEINLKLMRTFSLYAGPVVIAYRFIFLYSDPDAIDPIWLRITIAGMYTSFFLASYLVPAAKKHATALFQVIQYATTFWLAYLTYLNNLSSSVTLGFIVVIVTIYFVFHTKKAIAVYASVVTILVILITFLAPAPEIVPLFFLSTIIVIAFFTYIILHSRLDAMDELDQNEAIMGTVFHESGDAFLVIDEEAESVISYNSTVFETLGVRTIDQLLTRLCTLLSDSDTEDAPAQDIAQLIAVAPKDKRVEIESNQSKRWIDIRLKKIGNNNKKLLLAKLSDITQGKKIDEYRIARDAAEEANRLKDSFLATMSHELRTPMNGVIGMANLLTYTTLDEEQTECVDTIRVSGENLLNILNDILEFTRLGSGLTEKDEQVFSPVEIMEEVLELVALDAYAKKIELVAMPDVYGRKEVIGDSKRSWQILMNVIGNAVKFTQKGEIVVSLQTEEIDAQNLELHFSVRDTGIGIPADSIQQIFDHFKQVDGSMAREFEGIGLGLAITKEMVELLGGKIWVESILGKGSTFHWNIPVTVAEQQPDKVHKHVFEDHLSVLVLDDNSQNLVRIEGLLKSQGIASYTTDDPSEAMVRIENGHTFDVALIDLFIPGHDTFEIARTLKKLSNNDLRVILLAPMGVKTDFTADIADAMLTKPILEEAFFRRLTSVTTPISKVPSARTSARERSDALPRKSDLRILLVEDNIMNQRVALQTLSVLGYTADVADNGQHALECLQETTYHLIFMDLQMPEMDGLEATRQIRKQFADASPYIVALTANALDSDFEQCMAAGMDSFLAKPINIKELKATFEAFEAQFEGQFNATHQVTGI